MSDENKPNIEFTEQGLDVNGINQAVSVMGLDDLRTIVPIIGPMAGREGVDLPPATATKYDLRAFIGDCVKQLDDEKNVKALHIVGIEVGTIMSDRDLEARNKNLATIRENAHRIE